MYISDRNSQVIYQRFLERNISPQRHKGHVLNDCYPQEREHCVEELRAASISYEDYLYGITHRGFDTFSVDGGQMIVDTTDFSQVDMDDVLRQVLAWKEKVL